MRGRGAISWTFARCVRLRRNGRWCVAGIRAETDVAHETRLTEEAAASTCKRVIRFRLGGMHAGDRIITSTETSVVVPRITLLGARTCTYGDNARANRKNSRRRASGSPAGEARALHVRKNTHTQTRTHNRFHDERRGSWELSKDNEAHAETECTGSIAFFASARYSLTSMYFFLSTHILHLPMDIRFLYSVALHSVLLL